MSRDSARAVSYKSWSNMSPEEKAHDLLHVVIGVFTGTAIICIMIYLLGFLVSSVPPNRAVFNVIGLKRELNERVYGQEDAVREILWSIRNVMTDPAPSPHRVVFLLGGPGVGKSHVIDILMKHINCEAPDHTFCKIEFTQQVCKTLTPSLFQEQTLIPWFHDHVDGYWYHYKNFGEIKGVSFWAAELKNLYKYIEDNNLRHLSGQLTSNGIHSPKRTGIHDRVIYFVTGNILNVKDLEKLNSREQYERLVNKAADKLEAYMQQHAPELDVIFIKLKPLGPDHVVKCLRDQEAGTEQEIQALVAAKKKNDFVSQGCKLH